MKKVTVIVPVYNAEKYLRKSVKSILNQTYENLEVFLINDGSTDNSLEICQKFSNSDVRIKVLDKKNGGVSSARNFGLSKSTGDYVLFVDSDDFINENMIEKMVYHIELHNADIVECGYNTIKGTELIDNKKFKEEIVLGGLEYCSSLIQKKNSAHAVWNKLFTSEILSGIVFQSFNYAEDLLFNAEVAIRSEKKITISEIMYNYVSNETSAMNLSFSSRTLDDIEVRKILYDKFKDETLFDEISLDIAKDLLAKIVLILDLLVRSDERKNLQYLNYLREQFEKYYKIVPNSYLKKIKPERLYYGVLFYHYFPKEFRLLLQLYVKFK